MQRTTGMDRRTFLGRGAAFAGAGLFSSAAAQALTNRAALARSARQGMSPYGPVFPTADMATGREILALPRGFRYTTFGRIGSPMSDGSVTPLALDGMHAFPHPHDANLVRLIRNHEDRNPPGQGSNRVLPGEAGAVYDAAAGGGTSTLDFDPRTGQLVQDFISLKGSIVNCAGGYSLGFRGWLTGEEHNGAAFPKRHGYVFHVPADRDMEDSDASEPIVPMGRFFHEAVATDHRTGIVYETEDPGSGVGAGFYRYIPDDPWNLHAGGRLQMLGIQDRPQADLRQGQERGRRMRVVWYDIHDVDPSTTDNKTSQSVFGQGYSQGGAKFNRLEGCFWDGKGGIYFVSTSGGDVKNGDVNSDGYHEGYGQIWYYRAGRRRGHGHAYGHERARGRVAADDDGELTLVYESDGAEALDSPDNMCVSPRGGLVLCEDDASDADGDTHPTAPDIENVNRLIGYGRDGRVFEFAVNRLNGSELAGATYSPDGRWLFFNIFGDAQGSVTPYTGAEGMTVALTGPWGNGPL